MAGSAVAPRAPRTSTASTVVGPNARVGFDGWRTSESENPHLAPARAGDDRVLCCTVCTAPPYRPGNLFYFIFISNSTVTSFPCCPMVVS